MSILRTLVVGVDGTATSSAALAWAVRRLGAGDTLAVVNADPRRRTIDEDWISATGDALCSVSTHVVDEEASRGLLSVAELVEADAIVVGPHSGGLNRQTLGGVTRRLLQRSSIPVIVAKSESSQPSNTVVGCVGYGDATEHAATWAAGYAEQRGLDLELLHVVGYRPLFPVDSPSDMLAFYFGPDTLRRWAKEDVEEIRDRLALESPDLAISTTIDVGFASQAIVAASAAAEMVVVGKRRNNIALRSLISPRISQLIAKATTTVAVVPSCSIKP